MGKIKFILLLFCIVAIKLDAAAQQHAKERILEIASMRVHDTVRLSLLMQNAQVAMASSDTVAILFVDEALRISGTLNMNGAGAEKLYILKSEYYFKIRNLDSATTALNTLLVMAQNNGNQKMVAAAYQKLGEIDILKGAVPLAVEYQTKSLKEYQSIRDSEGIIQSYNALGNSFIMLNQPRKTIELLNSAINIAKTSGNMPGLARLYNTIGSAHADLNNDSMVLYYQREAFTIYTRVDDLKGLVTTSVILGKLYEKQKNYPFAKEYYLKGIAFANQNSDPSDLGLLYYNLGVNYYNMKEKQLASSALDSSINYSTLYQDKLVLSKAYRHKSFIYIDNGDYRLGYEYSKKYNALNDSIYDHNLQSSMAEMQTRYESEKKERRLQEERFADTKRNYWIIGILIFLTASILLLISWYKRQKLHEEKKFHQAIIAQQDLATKAVIEAEENERKRIAGDLHDGVGQMMSAAKMNLSSFESKANFRTAEDKLAFDKIISLVDDSCTEVRNVSHNMMPNALLKSGLASAIKEFIEKIDNRKLKVNLHAEGLNERLDQNIETVLYRVIQECVNNVIKHSGANHLEISLIKDQDGISATIEDNGVGFDLKLKDRFDGIGLKNIETRISYLKGTIEFDSRPGRGTLVAIHVPMQTFKVIHN